MPQHARILLVDDDEVDFVITKRLLEQIPDARYELDWAESYDDAVHQLAARRHDACLIDYRLGQQSGLDLMRQAGREGWSVPMILLTGKGNREVDTEALALGAVGYLEKSQLGAGELDRALRYALAREGLIHELVEHNAELLCMHRLTATLIGAGTLEDRMARALDDLAQHTGLSVALAEWFDPRTEELRTLAVRGLHKRDVPTASHRADDSPAQPALAARRPLLLLDATVADAGRAKPWPWCGTLLAFPMQAEGRLLGAITLADHHAHAIDSDLLQRTAVLVEHVGRMTQLSMQH